MERKEPGLKGEEVFMGLIRLMGFILYSDYKIDSWSLQKFEKIGKDKENTSHILSHG